MNVNRKPRPDHSRSILHSKTRKPSLMTRDRMIRIFPAEELASLSSTGAIDRFVYIHGHTTSNVSSWSKWCRRVSTKSGSIILLILPLLCSLPIASCNLLHAHVLLTLSQTKICTVLYNHGILISLLIFFYVLPLLFSFFLHAKLIYFIRSKHQQNYLATNAVPSKRTPTLESQTMMVKWRRTLEEKIGGNVQPQCQTRIVAEKHSNRQPFPSNTRTVPNTAGTVMTMSTSAAARQQVVRHNSSNSSASVRSYTGTVATTLPSPIILYKINSQANANANRTVLLLVSLLSFYVLCWAPYNVYTWHHVYQLTANTHQHPLANRSIFADLNQTQTPYLHSDLRRIILINYSLYLLSMISMCFSFIFYFSLNKQARHHLSRLVSNLCSCFVGKRNELRRETFPTPEHGKAKRLQYKAKLQVPAPKNKPAPSPPVNSNQRMKTTKFDEHPIVVATNPLDVDAKKPRKRSDSAQSRLYVHASKQTAFGHDFRIQCWR